MNSRMFTGREGRRGMLIRAAMASFGVAVLGSGLAVAPSWRTAEGISRDYDIFAVGALAVIAGTYVAARSLRRQRLPVSLFVGHVLRGSAASGVTGFFGAGAGIASEQEGSIFALVFFAPAVVAFVLVTLRDIERRPPPGDDRT